MATSELSTGKTIFVLTVVAGCFAVLWPKIFYPMFFGSPQYVSNLEKAQGAASGCCDVIFEKDIQTLKIITQLCEENVLINTITNESKPLSKQAMLNLCYKQLYETCNIDLSNLFKMSQRHELDSSFKQFINIVRTFNSSLCLKYHYHVNFNLIGTPRIIKSNVMKPTSLINAKNEKPQLQPQMRQERPPHMRPEMLHPALRENGRVIPHEHIVPRVEPDLPPRPVVKHPGSPKPGMGRPSFGGTGPHQAAKQGGGIMNLLMPMYTISIVAFFIYTMLRIWDPMILFIKLVLQFISNSSNNGPGTPSHDFYSGSAAEFRSSYYGEELCSAGGGGGRKQLEDGKTAGAGSEKTGPRLVVSAISGLLEQVNREILDSNPGLVSDSSQDGVQSDNVTKPEAQVAPQVAPQVNTSSLDSRQNSILEVEVNDYGDVQEVLDRQKALEEAKRQKKLQEEREKELELALKMEEERRVEEQRLKEVERLKEEERKRLEEEERKRIEEQKRIEEEERQRKELERLAEEQKRREELKRIEEEERQKELQRQKELEELKRIEEEERQRKELERLAEEQEQKRREEERQKELERQKEEERRIEAEQEVERLNELREQRRMEEDRKKKEAEDKILEEQREKEDERQLFAKIEQEKEEKTKSVEEEDKILGSKDKLEEELVKEIHEPIQLANKSQELAKSPEELIKENIEKISEELNKTIIEPLEHEISRKETIGAERKTELNGHSSEAIDGKEFAHEPGRQQTIDSEDTSDSSTLKESLESLGKTKSHEASRPAPIGDSRDPTEEIDASAVQVIGMERTESLVGGQKWSPPTTAFPAHSARPATPGNLTEQSASGPVTSRPATPGNFTGDESSTPAEPHKIILDGVLPEASQILVADELTETETEDGESDNDSVILSSRVTLSLIPSGSNEDQVDGGSGGEEEMNGKPAGVLSTSSTSSTGAKRPSSLHLEETTSGNSRGTERAQSKHFPTNHAHKQEESSDEELEDEQDEHRQNAQRRNINTVSNNDRRANNDRSSNDRQTSNERSNDRLPKSDNKDTHMERNTKANGKEVSSDEEQSEEYEVEEETDVEMEDEDKEGVEIEDLEEYDEEEAGGEEEEVEYEYEEEEDDEDNEEEDIPKENKKQK